MQNAKCTGTYAHKHTYSTEYTRLLARTHAHTLHTYLYTVCILLFVLVYSLELLSIGADWLARATGRCAAMAAAISWRHCNVVCMYCTFLVVTA